MNIFDIIGPVMVGPSSSHTAGAVRIGYVSRKLLGEPVKAVKLLLYGSFLATGKGHGTDRALIAGLLGMQPDDERVPFSFEEAEATGMTFEFGEANLKEAHPNSVVLKMVGESGKELEVIAASLGGGRMKICQLDGMEANFCAEYPTLIVQNLDQPGCVATVTTMLSELGINIATLQLYRDSRGGDAVMVVECDREVPVDAIRWLESRDGIDRVTYYSMK
ncbi:MAG: L-serine ammonia-lyase, iron-sulfur-dependent subunit beta [Lachnospiraceae bacterium]|nr:L-serine ammonia-lyase, iron-sulfur-dependent subunit beta [Lachnospiraceae bacterium]